MEFNFANQEDLFISRELIFAKFDFSLQKYWQNKLKNQFFKLPRKFENCISWELIFANQANQVFSRPFNFANLGVIRENREIF